MADDDLLDQYLAKDKAAPVAAAPSAAGEPDGLDSYLRADQAATVASATAASHSAAPIVSPHPGILANEPDENPALGIAKDAGTGAVRGVGDMAGVVGNTGNLADYLVARGESLFTHQPPDQIMADMQARRQAQDAAWASSQNPLERVLSAVNPRNIFPTGAQVAAPLLAATGEHVPTSEPGRIAQGAAETVTGALGPGVIGAPAAVPGLIGQTLARAPVTAAAGAGGTEVTDATNDPLLGLLATGAPALAMKGMAGLGGKIVGQVDPYVANLADVARNQYGIPITAPQMSASPALKTLDFISSKLPFSGSNKGDISSAYMRAISHEMGQDAPALTQPVIDAARAQAGATMNRVEAATSIPYDQQLHNDLNTVLQNTSIVHGMPPEQTNAVRAQVQQIADTFGANNGVIPGDVYGQLTGHHSLLQQGIDSQNGTVSQSAKQIKTALQDAIGRNASPQDQADYSQAKYFYKNARIFDPNDKSGLVDRFDTGQIPGPTAAAAIKSSYGGLPNSGIASPMGDLARIGQNFLKTQPSSGTAENLAAIGALRALPATALGAIGAGGIYGGMSPASALLSGAGVGATLGLNRAVNAGLRSNALAEALINRSLGRNMTPSLSQELANRLMLPYAPQVGARLGAPAAKSP